MVMLAEKMRQKLLSAPTTQSGANDEEMGSKQEMQDWMLSVGIASPVTKESAGALYHQQLSRQVLHFLSLLFYNRTDVIKYNLYLESFHRENKDVKIGLLNSNYYHLFLSSISTFTCYPMVMEYKIISFFFF